MLAMENTALVTYMLHYGSRPSQEIAGLYAAQCRGSEDRDRLLDIMVIQGWAPPPSRLNGGDNRTGGRANTNDINTPPFVPSSKWGTSSSYHDEDGKARDFPLHDSIMKKLNVDPVELLRLGEDPNVLDSAGLSPLHVAASCGDAAATEALLVAGAALDLTCPPCGMTALHLAVSADSIEVTEVLLATALSNNKRKYPSSSSSSTPARGVAVAPYSSVVGDRTPSFSSSSSSPPRVATANGKKASSPSPMVDAKDDAGRSPLHLAAGICSTVHILDSLVRAGANVDSRDKRNRTPLFYAAKEDEAGAVKALLAAGASPDLRDDDGRGPLHIAVLRPAGAVLGALIAGGASAGAGGEKGITPLHAACESDTRGTVEALLRAGAVPGHCWNDRLLSPLMMACRAGSLNAVELLLPRLSVRQINMRDRPSGVDAGGETPLVAAVRHDCIHESDVIGIVDAVSFFEVFLVACAMLALLDVDRYFLFPLLPPVW